MRFRSILATAATVALVAGGVLLTAAPAQAATLQVGPGQTYSTIQAAVNAANNDDVIQVHDGTYRENVIVNGKYVTLRGNVTTPANVVIQAATVNNATLQLWGMATANRTVVEGFTITGGSSQSGQGGGITVHSASPELRNLVVTGNNAPQGYGGGMSIDLNSNPFIHDCVISNNRARDGGAGIFAITGSNPVIVDNQITGNTTTGASIPGGGSSGGGIYLESQPGQPSVKINAVIVGNTITGNAAQFAGGGISLRTGVNAIIEGNTINGNTATYGGGIHAETEGGAVTVDGNTISGNTANLGGSGSGYGGGISIYSSSQMTIVRNTISANTSATGGAGITAAESSASTIDANTISGNTITGSGGGGGGFYIANATATLTNNVFEGNTATGTGGGIALLDTSTTIVDHNTVVGNHETVAAGGGIFVRHNGGTVTAATIVNNIIAGNDGAQLFEEYEIARVDNNFFGLASGRAAQGGAGLYFNYHTNWLNSAAAINSSGNVTGTANVDGDPGFTSVANHDYTLQSSSGAVNHATSTNVPSVTRDRRGAQRSAPNDIGAYEYLVSPVLSETPTITGDPTVGATLTAHPGSWGTAPTTWTYQWKSGSTVIAGATGPSYVPGIADTGAPISVVVTGTKYGQYIRPFTTAPTTAIVRLSYFADVTPSHPFFTPIEWMASTKLSTGTPNLPGAPLYKPSDSVSRQAMAAFLMRNAQVTGFTPPTDPTFADVDASNPFFTQIEWMYAAGITAGTPQTSGKPLYSPAAAVTRQAMAEFLAHFDHIDISTPPTVQSFADVPVDYPGAAAIAWMKSSGISTGTAQPSGLPLYKPADPVSRQAMAAFLQRLDALPAP